MNHASILSDRQIRALCEVTVGELQFSDLRTRGFSNQVFVPLFQEDLADLSASIARLGKIYADNEHAEHVERFDEEWVARERANFKPMIEPFFAQQVKTREVPILNAPAQPQTLDEIRRVEKIVSLGLSSFGYDVTCGREFKIFTNVNSAIVDPKNFDKGSFVDVVTTDEKPYILIPPNSFALAVTKEYFRIPRNVLTVCLGKSTYARCGIIVNVTPFEPEWEGYVTLEFSNTTPLPAKIYADEGCAQVLFLQGSEPCEVSYKDRGGKYQSQANQPVVPKV